jgi:hypothetical protein
MTTGGRLALRCQSAATRQKPKTGKLSLYPLSIEDALRGAAQTGVPLKATRTKKVDRQRSK